MSRGGARASSARAPPRQPVRRDRRSAGGQGRRAAAIAAGGGGDRRRKLAAFCWPRGRAFRRLGGTPCRGAAPGAAPGGAPGWRRGGGRPLACRLARDYSRDLCCLCCGRGGPSGWAGPQASLCHSLCRCRCRRALARRCGAEPGAPRRRLRATGSVLRPPAAGSAKCDLRGGPRAVTSGRAPPGTFTPGVFTGGGSGFPPPLRVTFGPGGRRALCSASLSSAYRSSAARSWGSQLSLPQLFVSPSGAVSPSAVSPSAVWACPLGVWGLRSHPVPSRRAASVTSFLWSVRPAFLLPLFRLPAARPPLPQRRPGSASL